MSQQMLVTAPFKMREEEKTKTVEDYSQPGTRNDDHHCELDGWNQIATNRGFST